MDNHWYVNIHLDLNFEYRLVEFITMRVTNMDVQDLISQMIFQEIQMES